MADSKKLDFELLNYLTTEIIVLNESLNVLCINESAQANGWNKDVNDPTSFSNLLSVDTKDEIRRIINLSRILLKLIGYSYFAQEKNLNLLSYADFNDILKTFTNIDFKIIKIKLLGFTSNLIAICQKKN